MSTLRDTDPATDALLDFIAHFESAGNYNAVIGDAQSADDLSALTLNGIYVLQDRLVSRGLPSSAVGRYQIIKATLRGLQAAEKLSGSDRFTPELQDRLAVALLAQRGYSAWWRREIGDGEFMHRLSMEWAAMPDPENGGKSHYDGVGPNRAGTTLERVAEMLTQVRALIDQTAAPVEPTEDHGHPFEAAPAVGAALMADAVRVVQGLLAAAGHAPGLADGVWGERTQAAYTAFLREARR